MDGEMEESDDGQEAPQFPELEEQVQQAIDHLGGSVFPKLNWSSPKDAAWIAVERNLKCRMFADIALLLKSSDFISHDLNHWDEYCEEKGCDMSFELILRKWMHLNPAMEFRCFVKDNRLIGTIFIVCLSLELTIYGTAISQRDVSNYYDHLPDVQEEICGSICAFFEEKIKNQFALSDCTFLHLSP